MSDYKHVLLWRKHKFPIDWSREFPTTADLHLEIGFGDGRFTTYEAESEPQNNFVALEISGSSLYRALKRLKSAGISNVKLLKVAAGFALQNFFEANSLNSIVVNFPDPWPKERHEKNRLLQDRFFRLAANRLKSNGEIRLATDHKKYLEFARKESQISKMFDLVETDVPAAVFETKYALKWKKEGKPLFYQVFRYNGASTPDYPTIERSDDMPHAVLVGKMPEDFKFEKQVIKYGDGHVVLHEVAKSYDYNNETRERYLLRVSIDEPDFNQQLLVIIRRKTDNEFLVRFASFGDPIITKTARGAIHAVSEWMLSLTDEMELRERNY